MMPIMPNIAFSAHDIVTEIMRQMGVADDTNFDLCMFAI